MAKHRKVIYDSTYKGHPINTDINKGYGCDTRILDANKRTIDGSLADSSKVLAIRYDVRFPATMEIDGSSNEIFTDAQADFCKHLSRQGLKPKYVAVRERGDSKTPHYHVALFLDGQKTQSAYNHVKKADEILARKLGLDPNRSHGLVYACDVKREGEGKTDGYMLTRNGQDEYQKVFYRCSYLAKVATKPADGVRELFVSKRAKKSENQERK